MQGAGIVSVIACRFAYSIAPLVVSTRRAAA